MTRTTIRFHPGPGVVSRRISFPVGRTFTWTPDGVSVYVVVLLVLDAGERTHVSIVRICFIQERIVIVLVLVKPCYSLPHAPRSLHGGAGQVRM